MTTNSKLSSSLKYTPEETTVFWDIEDCPIPDGLNVEDVAHNIETALANMGYPGPVTIMAYGDQSTRDDFYSAGIPLTRAPIEKFLDCYSPTLPDSIKSLQKRYTRLNMIFRDFHVWAMNNTAQEANLMLIVGDISEYDEIIKAVNRLQMKDYNFLLAQSQYALPECLSATSKWLWTSLSTGGKPMEESGSSQRVDDISVGSGSSQGEGVTPSS